MIRLNKKFLISIIALLVLFATVFAVLSFTLADESTDNKTLTADANTANGPVSVIDYIIEFSNSTDPDIDKTYHVLELGSSDKPSDLEALISSDGFRKYVINENKSESYTGEMTAGADKIEYIYYNVTKGNQAQITVTRTTDANGKSSVGINLPVGEYNATFYFDGDEIKYSPCSGMSHITVNTSIYSESYMKKYCKGPEPYEARFLDKNGNYLTQGKAIFNINGVLYERNVKDGTARLNINLEPGNYTITATNPVTGEGKASLIEVLPTIIDNHDLVKYYRNDSQYVVKLDDDLTDKKVTFNINGVFYERYANESGHVKLNINLQPGEYIITAEHNGCRVANNIVVLPVLNASDLEMRYLDGSQFNVTLLDGEGKPYAGQNVTFNVNGVFYVRTTDVNGVAHLNINLMTGEYIITSSYNGSNIANKITISS